MADGFCQQLVAKGYRVIRFDNRDIGLSTKLSDLKVKGPFWQRMLRAQFGLTSSVPYTLHDMAEDVRGLLDFLQIPAVHVVGASMGGMIAQLLLQNIRTVCARWALFFPALIKRFCHHPNKRP